MAYARRVEDYRVVRTAEAVPEEGRIPDWMSELDDSLRGG